MDWRRVHFTRGPKIRATPPPALGKPFNLTETWNYAYLSLHIQQGLRSGETPCCSLIRSDEATDGKQFENCKAFSFFQHECKLEFVFIVIIPFQQSPLPGKALTVGAPNND